MRDLDWKIVSKLSYLIGGVSFLAYWIAYFYGYTGVLGLTIYPYRDFCYFLVGFGIGFHFLGHYFRQTSKGKASFFNRKEPIVKKGYCSDCGGARNFDARYCKKCGKQLS